MRKKPIFMCITVAVFASACTKSDEDKIKESVRKHIIENANDPESYEEVSWSNIDTLYLEYIETQEGLAYKKQIDSLQKIRDNSEQQDAVSGRILKLFKEAADKETAYNKHKSKGYSINHKMRGKNALGALVLSETKFTVDTNYTVVSAENLSFPKFDQ